MRWAHEKIIGRVPVSITINKAAAKNSRELKNTVNYRTRYILRKRIACALSISLKHTHHHLTSKHAHLIDKRILPAPGMAEV